jgi:hypothetical protein
VATDGDPRLQSCLGLKAFDVTSSRMQTKAKQIHVMSKIYYSPPQFFASQTLIQSFFVTLCHGFYLEDLSKSKEKKKLQ